MKNESRFAESRKFAIAAIGSLSDMLAAIANRPGPDYRYRADKRPTARPSNKLAGSKLMKHADLGTLGLGVHRSSGKRPIEGANFSPKKDIGKGPAKTLSHRQMTLRDKPKSRIARRGHYA